MTILVFDNTALSHFARAGRLNELELIARPRECVTLVQVLEEVSKGVAAYPELEMIAGQEWLRTVDIVELAELSAFARYKGEFGGGPDRNNGEAAVLAWTAVNGGTAIVDEIVARGAGRRDGIETQGSLWLVIGGYKSGILDRATAESVVDDLIGSEMRLPLDDGPGLFTWAYKEGLLP